jgi:peptidoglycan/xylan/chitin deacetylase (PgdA/CDA1 family)
MAAGALAAAGRSRPRRDAILPLYHAVVREPGEGDRFAIPLERFRRHLDALRALGTRTRPLARWWPAPGRWLAAVVVCFDDGGRSDYDFAFPLLAERGLTATFFVNPATVDTPGYVTWPELREMSRAGMEIASHGYRHEVLTSLPPAQLAASLATSRHILQDRLGTPVQFLAAPYGLWNRRVLDAALCAGYSALCTSRPARARPGDAVLPRIAAGGGTSVAQLQGWCRGRWADLLWRAGRDRCLWLPRHILLHCRPHWPAPPQPHAGSRSMS